MTPLNPAIYHITHINNLQSIITDGNIFSDAFCLAKDSRNENIGISEIKRRRLEDIKVECNPGTYVGEYVPFYFCSRSIMLYLIYKGNHEDLEYRQGQDQVVHIKADLRKTIQWADNNSIPRAFSDRNAGAYYAEFYNTLNELKYINWDAVKASDFRNPVIKDGKQAEFLLYKSFPIDLIEVIGVIDRSVELRVKQIIDNTVLHGKVKVHNDWYF